MIVEELEALKQVLTVNERNKMSYRKLVQYWLM